MKDQIKTLKLELREFLELSKTATAGKWELCQTSCGIDIQSTSRKLWVANSSDMVAPNAAFIARSRNISPAMAECLLSQIEWLEQCAIPVESANQQLQQILTLWEATK